MFWYFGKPAKMFFLLQFSRFAKLTSLSCYMLSRLSFLIKVPCYPCFLFKKTAKYFAITLFISTFAPQRCAHLCIPMLIPTGWHHE